MITHDEAMAILWEHGQLIGWTPTAWKPDPDCSQDDTSTFYWQYGVQAHYRRRDVYWWLGY